MTLIEKLCSFIYMCAAPREIIFADVVAVAATSSGVDIDVNRGATVRRCINLKTCIGKAYKCRVSNDHYSLCPWLEPPHHHSVRKHRTKQRT